MAKGIKGFQKGNKCWQHPNAVATRFKKGRVSHHQEKGLTNSGSFKTGHKTNVGRKATTETMKKLKPYLFKKRNAIRNTGRTRFKEGGVGFPHKHTLVSKEKMRTSRLNYIKQTCGKVSPTKGKYETKILNELEKMINYKILRQYFVKGFFLDGYCPALNMAIEIDEPHHFINKYVQKDIERQNIIEEKLGCNFFRIKIPKGF